MGCLGRLAVRGHPLGLVPQVALEVGDLRAGDQRGVDVVRAEQLADAEIGVHRALCVGCDDDEATTGRHTERARRAGERDSGRLEVVAEHLAELVVGDLPDVGARPAERRDAGHRVRGGTSRLLDARPHRVVQVLRALRVDQGHRGLHEPVGVEERVVTIGQHVDEGISDADDVEERCFASDTGENLPGPPGQRVHLHRYAARHDRRARLPPAAHCRPSAYELTPRARPGRRDVLGRVPRSRSTSPTPHMRSGQRRRPRHRSGVVRRHVRHEPQHGSHRRR